MPLPYIYITIQKHLAPSPCFLHLSRSHSQSRCSTSASTPALSLASVSVLLQMCRRRSQPLRFLSLPSLSCALTPTTTTVPFLIERLASRDGRNQANSSGIEQKAESSGRCTKAGGSMCVRRQGDTLPLWRHLTASALKRGLNNLGKYVTKYNLVGNERSFTQKQP